MVNERLGFKKLAKQSSNVTLSCFIKMWRILAKCRRTDFRGSLVHLSQSCFAFYFVTVRITSGITGMYLLYNPCCCPVVLLGMRDVLSLCHFEGSLWTMPTNLWLFKKEKQEQLLYLRLSLSKCSEMPNKSIVERSFFMRDVQFFFCLPGRQRFHHKGNIMSVILCPAPRYV